MKRVFKIRVLSMQTIRKRTDDFKVLYLAQFDSVRIDELQTT